MNEVVAKSTATEKSGSTDPREEVHGMVTRVEKSCRCITMPHDPTCARSGFSGFAGNFMYTHNSCRIKKIDNR